MTIVSKDTTFLGYRRENGRVGIRNHVIILPLDDLSNSAAEAVAHNIKGALAIPHPYGRLQFGADLDLHFRTLIGTGCNPNVAAVVVIGIEDSWTAKVVEGIAATGKPVVGFGIEGHGLGRGVGQVVQRQDDDVVAHADAAVLTPVAEEGGVWGDDAHAVTPEGCLIEPSPLTGLCPAAEAPP